MITKDDVGKEVISEVFGKGKIIEFRKDESTFIWKYPVVIKFRHGIETFTTTGIWDNLTGGGIRNIKLLVEDQK